MEADAERTLNNLHVIAALSQNDKLITSTDVFDIYTPTTLRGLWRTWYGECRGNNVQRVRQTVRAGIAFSQRSLEEATALRDTNTARLRLDTVCLQHVRMIEALQNAKRGIHNLLQTYRDDAALSSQITLLMTEIDDFVRVITPHTRDMQSVGILLAS